MKTLTTTILAFVLPIIMIGQNCSSDYKEYLDVNNVKATYYNGGDMFWDLTANPGYVVPANVPSYDQRHSMFAAGIWMGGLDQNGALHQAAQTYRQSGNDYFPGPVRTTGGYGCHATVDLNTPPYFGQLLQHSSGKMLHFYHTGYTITDPGTYNMTPKILPITRSGYQAVELQNGKVLLFGEDKPLAQEATILLDATNFNATVGFQLNHSHTMSTGTVLQNGNVLIAGRFGCEIYNAATGASTPINGMITPAQAKSSILLQSGKVLLVGGSTTAIGSTTPTVKTTEIFDPSNNTFTAGPNMSWARSRPALTLLPSGKVLIAGGNTLTDDLELYDPATGNIVTAASLQSTGDLCSSTLMPTGDVLIVYFNGGNGRAEVFDTTTYNLTPVPLQNLGWEATTMSNGDVLIQRSAEHFSKYDPVTNTFPDMPWQKIWKLNKSQIDQFKVDQAGGNIQWSNYPDIQSWPAHGDASFGEDYHLAPFMDVNMDGKYDPAGGGDYPCIMGDQALFWIFNDDADAHTESGGNELGVQVETMVYGFNCQATSCPDTALDYTTFYHFELVNKSNHDYEDYYFGFWVDYDLGNFVDDYVGCDTNLGMAYCYNGDADDEGASGYGIDPPAIGNVVLNAPQGKSMTNFTYYENDFSFRGNPEQASHHYGYLQSYWKDGSHVVNNGTNGHSGSGSGPTIDFMYPGEVCPTTSGWTEVSAMNQPFDRRGLQSIGPLEFNSGDTLRFDFAIIWARKIGAGHLGNVCELKSSAQTIKTWWSNLTKDCFNLSVATSTPPPAPEFKLYPNPTSDIVRIELGKDVRELESISIFDMYGKEILHSNYPIGARAADVHVEHLPTGVYMVNINADGRTASKKLMVE